MHPPLDLWNAVTVNLGQAFLGSISANVRAISLSFEDEKWMVRFTLEAASAMDEEELAEALTDCEAMDGIFSAYRFEFVATNNGIARPEFPGRLIYQRRE